MPAGRKPKSTEQKIIEGNRSKNPNLEKQYENQPKPTDGDIVCPAIVKRNKVALAEWHRIVPELHASCGAKPLDSMTIGQYCMAIAEWGRCLNLVQKEGRYIDQTNKAGATNKVSHPAVKDAQKWQTICKGYISEFGLSASARGRMQLPSQENKKKSKMAEILKMNPRAKGAV